MVFNIQSREKAHQLSQTLDNIGNYTLIAATVIGLISIDLVILAKICQKANEPRDEHHHHMDKEDWELFWLTRMYWRSWEHHCCHDYHYYHHRHRRDDNFFSYEVFAATTMLVSLICTAAAISLAIHFHLPGMVLFLSGIWLTAFALKMMAWAIRPDMSLVPEVTPAPSAPPMTTLFANEISVSSQIPVATPVSMFDYSSAVYVDAKVTEPSAPPAPNWR